VAKKKSSVHTTSETHRLKERERVRCSADNGRVLGYDNSHDYHHRHFMGEVEAIEFTTYAALAERFIGEVHELWRLEDEEK
jgi:Family of unknown function (DUF6516)